MINPIYGSWFNDTRLVAKDPLKLKNAMNTCLIIHNIILYYSYLHPLFFIITFYYASCMKQASSLKQAAFLGHASKS